MTLPVIGFAGMTHLGLVSAVAAAARGLHTLCFDPSAKLIAGLEAGHLAVVEPGLPELLSGNRERLVFTHRALDLAGCDVVFIALDVATDDQGQSDLSGLEVLLDLAQPNVRVGAVEVILSQAPPGFTRARKRQGHDLFYQVETLIFGNAVDRALNPERIIVGCADPDQPLPEPYQAYLGEFNCPILPMRYESAELAKIAINCYLISSISVANTLAELCERIGADWSEIMPALKLDKRIGEHAYLKPGLGLAGGNLERDLATILGLARSQGADGGVAASWLANSRHRKDWAYRTLKEEVLDRHPGTAIAVWGLAYKENTHSTMNSPSLALLGHLAGVDVTVYDPVVPAEAVGKTIKGASGALEAVSGAQVLLIMTPWPEFKEIEPSAIAAAMQGRTLIDPYGVLDRHAVAQAGFDHFTLGARPLRTGT